MVRINISHNYIQCWKLLRRISQTNDLKFSWFWKDISKRTKPRTSKACQNLARPTGKWFRKPNMLRNRKRWQRKIRASSVTSLATEKWFFLFFLQGWKPRKSEKELQVFDIRYGTHIYNRRIDFHLAPGIWY